MGINLSAFFNILATPPGDLIYHLVISLALILTVGFALANAARSQNNSLSRQTLVSCAIVLFLQILLFSLRFFKPETDHTGIQFYPLFERLAAVLTITWLIWAFSHNEKHLDLNRVSIFLSLAFCILAAVFLAVLPRLQQTGGFNPRTFDLIWQLIAIILALSGVVLAAVKRPPQRVVMLLMLLLLAGGHIFQILLQGELQWEMGAVRVMQTLSLPWVMVLIQRFSKGEDQAQLHEIGSENGYTEIPIDTKPLLVNFLLKINLTETGEEKRQAVVRALSLSVVADICYLLKIDEGKDKLYVIAGYDLIREVNLMPDTLVKEDLPRVIAAWQSNQSLEFFLDNSEVRDAATLTMLLRYHSLGHIFAYPLVLPENQLVGGVIFLSPYTGKRWGDQTRQLMDEVRDTLAQVLYTPDPLEQTRELLEIVQLQVSTLNQESEKLRLALEDKNAQIRDKETLIKELKAKYQIEKMETVTSSEQMKGRIAELSSQVALQRGLASQLEQLKTEIRQLTSEREQLSLALNRANAMVKDLQTQTGQTGPIRLSLESQIISLDSIAANVRLRAAPLLQQKEVDFEINNPDGRQMIKTDPELLQTALLELITNAINASEPGGTIQLDQRLALEMGMLTIQVTDFGDGLSQAEQTALFSGQHAAIPGIGDVNAIRNAIRAIRVLNGKIWLRSKKSSYTTFRFQIPVRIID